MVFLGRKYPPELETKLKIGNEARNPKSSLKPYTKIETGRES